MKKIMFNDKYGLTKAVLEGRKTMTRRIIPADVAKKLIIPGEPGFFPDVPCMGIDKHSRYKVGEVVAVAQNYKDVREGGYPVDSRYDAFREADWGIGVNGALKGSAGETNKMFVRAELMPHKIRIKNVRVERLQYITKDECIREGIRTFRTDFVDEEPLYSFGETIKNRKVFYLTPRLAFAALIDKVSGKGTWASNPWVFVYEFELVK